MKRFLGGMALVGLLLSLAGTAQAQVPVKASIFGGVSLASAGGDAEDMLGVPLSSRLGFTGGAQIGFDLHPMFRLPLAAQYVQKGAKFEVTGGEGKFKLDYIEVRLPLTLKIPMEGSPITPRIYAGGYIAFEMSCKTSVTPTGGTAVSADCVDDDILTKSLDYGATFGAGVDFGVGATGAITLDVVYDLGLANIDDDPTTAAGMTVKNQAWLFLLGYQFSLGG